MPDELEEDVASSEMPRVTGALERATGCVLLAVLAVLGWMTLAAYFPEWGRVGRVEVEVAAVVLLLVAALGLVSLLALLHTRR
jgi:hypothetical protein